MRGLLLGLATLVVPAVAAPPPWWQESRCRWQSSIGAEAYGAKLPDSKDLSFPNEEDCQILLTSMILSSFPSVVNSGTTTRAHGRLEYLPYDHPELIKRCDYDVAEGKPVRKELLRYVLTTRGAGFANFQGPGDMEKELRSIVKVQCPKP